MSQTKTKTQGEIKTDFARAIKERRDFTIREQKAQEYLDLCERKRIAKAKRKEIIKEKAMIGIMGALVITVSVIKFASNANELKEPQHKTNATIELEQNVVSPTENLYEVLVTEIDNEENIVTVEYNGESYGFEFEENEYLVGEKIVCKFTDKMEIVNAYK